MRRGLLWFGIALSMAACEDDGLFFAPPEPDAGFFMDAAAPPPDAGFELDVGFAPDAEEPPPAEQPVYIHTGTTLFEYDPDTNSTTRVGDFHTASGELEPMVDIAIDLDGRMFGGAIDRTVYSIDPTTAECRFRFRFDDILHGLTFLSDGRLVVAGERVSVVDPSSGRVVFEFTGAVDFETSGDIVGLPDGNLYWTVRNSDREAGDGVVRINPENGDIRWIGEAAVTKIYGLGFAGEHLYGFSDTGAVVKLDPSNGRVIEHNQLEGRWWGATTNPVLWD